MADCRQPVLGLYSQSTTYNSNYPAVNAFDGDENTFAHTQVWTEFEQRPWMQAVVTEGHEEGEVPFGQKCNAVIKRLQVLGRKVSTHIKFAGIVLTTYI